MIEKIGNACLYSEIADGAYLLELIEPGKQSIDELFVFIHQIYDRHINDSIIRIAIDTSPAGDKVSFRYAIAAGFESNKNYRQRPPTRTAIILKELGLSGLTNAVIRPNLRRNDQLQLFGKKDMEKAKEWLLK